LKRPFRPATASSCRSWASRRRDGRRSMYTTLDQVGGTIAGGGRRAPHPRAQRHALRPGGHQLHGDQTPPTCSTSWSSASPSTPTGAGREDPHRRRQRRHRRHHQGHRMKPYIRSDMYDYGMYLRLRYRRGSRTAWRSPTSSRSSLRGRPAHAGGGLRHPLHLLLPRGLERKEDDKAEAAERAAIAAAARRPTRRPAASSRSAWRYPRRGAPARDPGRRAGRAEHRRAGAAAARRDRPPPGTADEFDLLAGTCAWPQQEARLEDDPGHSAGQPHGCTA